MWPAREAESVSLFAHGHLSFNLTSAAELHSSRKIFEAEKIHVAF